jgi:hypothetical protein
MLTPQERLRAVLRAACGDALFAIVGSGPRTLDEFAQRRAAAHDAIARGDGALPPTMVDPKDVAGFDQWLVVMARAAAPIGVPWFVPMRDAIDDGLSLEAEPRGLRSVLAIGAQAHAERTRRDGTLAVRILKAVSAADGEFGADEQRAIDALLAALALSDDDQRMLRSEGAVPTASLEFPDDLEPKLARSMVAGAWEAAASDGLEESERLAVLEVARRTKVPAEVAEAARLAAETAFAMQLRIGLAVIDALRYVLLPCPPEEIAPLVEACVRLGIPPLKRAEISRSITTREPTPLGREHELDRATRSLVLSATWAAAMSFDPSTTMRARLVERHDRVATDLRGERIGADARESVDEYLAKILARAVVLVGG